MIRVECNVCFVVRRALQGGDILKITPMRPLQGGDILKITPMRPLQGGDILKITPMTLQSHTLSMLLSEPLEPSSKSHPPINALNIRANAMRRYFKDNPNDSSVTYFKYAPFIALRAIFKISSTYQRSSYRNKT